MFCEYGTDCLTLSFIETMYVCDSRRAAAVVVSRHIVLRLGQRRLGFFEGVLHPVRR